MSRVVGLWVSLLLLLGSAVAVGEGEGPWVTHTESGDTQIHLYFFWSARCPHCQHAMPVVKALAERYPWLQVHALEVNQDRDNAILYMRMAEALGQTANAVPGFLFCGEMYTGFDSAAGVGKLLEERLTGCHAGAGRPGAAATAPSPSVAVPLLGDLDLRDLSLPLVAVIIAGLDAFNPCAFFVLLFLLSLLTHERMRSRMMVIGGVFVLCSGVVYFLLMAAWLNVFLLAGELRAVTLAAGAIALFVSLVNIKDYLWFKRGITLSIPESAKPKLYDRVRGLLRAESWPLMLVGTVMLAIAANSYEALCTAGFPMVYTRLLTLQDLTPGAYYGYLALYNLVYVTPLLVIVMAFVSTMGSRKLTESEGRVLKLVSGVMMLGLGTALLVQPQWLNSAWIAVSLLAAALAAGGIAYWRERQVRG